MPVSSAQRSSSSAWARRPEKAASATANDLASARPPKYSRTSSSPMVSPGKSDTSWETAAARPRRSWPTACTSAAVAAWSMRPPAARASDGHEPGVVARAQLGRLRLGHRRRACAAWSAPRCPSGRRRGPAPAPRRAPGRRRSRAGPATDSSGRSSSPRTTTQRVAENSDGGGELAQRGERQVDAAGLGHLGLGVVAAHRRADRLDRPLAQELLLAGHEGDPAEDVGCARTCHGAGPYRVVATAIPPSSTTTARSPSRSVRRTSTPAALERRQRRGSRVAVVVVRARRDQRQAGAEPEQPVGVLEPAAVVGHLDDVDREPRPGPRPGRAGWAARRRP